MAILHRNCWLVWAGTGGGFAIGMTGRLCIGMGDGFATGIGGWFLVEYALDELSPVFNSLVRNEMER